MGTCLYFPGIHVYRLHLLARVARAMIQHISEHTKYFTVTRYACSMWDVTLHGLNENVCKYVMRAILADMVYHRYLQDSPDMCV